MSSIRIASPREGAALRVAQITDTHLEDSRGGRLLGMDTDASLDHVLALLAAAPAPDLILATGDLANHASPAAYVRLCTRFDALGIPWFWLPGNHDEFAAMQTLLGGGAGMRRSILAGAWQIVLLDSTVAGEVAGELGHAELELLDALLTAEPSRPALVCLHHQPVPIGCAWLDEQMVSDAPAFFAVLRRHPQVRAVLWGHVHQEFDAVQGGLRLLASPSTCIQFAPGSPGFRVDEQSPGMRWLDLAPDGSLVTRVERVRGVAFSFDRDSAGYL